MRKKIYFNNKEGIDYSIYLKSRASTKYFFEWEDWILTVLLLCLETRTIVWKIIFIRYVYKNKTIWIDINFNFFASSVKKTMSSLIQIEEKTS